MSVRTRFAPSPTGFLHLGNARTALFAYLYARHCNGRFILRIEDTDQERLVKGSEKSILEDLKWLGCEWDEGPDVGGPLGPYRCSERYDLYNKELKRLQKNTRVYRCFATPAELEQDRKLQMAQGKPIKYSGRYRNLSDEESRKKAEAGEPFVWRMQVDENADPIKIKDEIRGEVSVHPNTLGDFVIFRSNGIPVFLFANAVDDALMEISHVTRGEDHLSNTFRQVLIFRALGYDEPIFAHLPMIGDSDGGKFSKRAGSLGITKLREEGFIPEGLINYLALLGWSPGDTGEHGEKFTKEELIQKFTLGRVNKSRALFDPNKLNFLNGAHLHDKSSEELGEKVPPSKEEWKVIWPQAIDLVKKDVSRLPELRKVEEFLEEPDFQNSAVAGQILREDNSSQIIDLALKKIEELLSQGVSVDEALRSATKHVGKELNLKGKQLFFPMRVALTAKDSGPELGPLSKVLGQERVLKRLKSALEYSRAA